jgi:ATP-dependent RNA helicase SUPV3L1/SUV3
MTSLTGASGEDFASILRSLGYRSERRPKPAEPAPLATDAPPVETPTPADGAAEAPGTEAIATGQDSDTLIATVELSPPISVAEDLPLSPLEPANEQPSEENSPAGSAADTAVEIPANALPLAEDAAFIEVWRPGRSAEHNRRPSRSPRGRAGREAPPLARDAAPSVQAQPEGAATQPGETPSPSPSRKPRPQRPKRQERPHRKEREGARPVFAKSRPAPERREKPADPNSPFAKLAELKAQLEANAKERH